MKKILISLIVMSVLLAALVLASCEKEHIHTFKETVVKPTCTFSGYTEYKCTDCGYTYQDTLVDPNPKSHVYGKAVVIKEATCSATGLKNQTCTQCGTVTQSTIAKTKHTNVDEVVLAATCTEAGTKKSTCSVCGYSSTSTIKATGHSYGDWVIDIPASCETGEYGHKYHVCDKCSLVEEQSVTPHTPKDKGQTTAPTCISIGYTTYVCADCGATYKANYKDALTNSDGTPKHTFGNWTKVEGCDNLQRRDCKYCNYYEVKETK